MRRATWMMAAVAGAALLAAPQGATAQQGDGWWEWALPSEASARGGEARGGEARERGRSLPDVILGREGARRDGRDGRDGARDNARNASAGPPFCRNGQGHPVHGMRWCRDKGFGTGGILGWERRGWDDVVLRDPRGTRRQGTLDGGGLIDVLGDVVFGRVSAEGSRAGAREPLTGRWLRTASGASVLQIRSGATPVAELTDLDGNGRVDAVLVPSRR